MSSSIALVLFFLGLLSIPIAQNLASGSFPSSELEQEMVPLIEDGVRMRLMLNFSESSRRKLNSFQTCSVCTCCGGAKGLCVASPCCYSIKCNIPNRPFGFCSFTPKTCNCFGCHV